MFLLARFICLLAKTYVSYLQSHWFYFIASTVSPQMKLVIVTSFVFRTVINDLSIKMNRLFLPINLS